MTKQEKIEKLIQELKDAESYANVMRLTWKGTTPLYQYREEWLNAAIKHMRPYFNDKAGLTYNGNVRVSCGFPKGARTAIGQCWTDTLSKDKTHEIFISPELDDMIEVTAVLVHEMIHALVGIPAGHGPIFRKAALSLGLIGQMTATIAGPQLIRYLSDMVDEIGVYPHATLRGITDRKKAGTRLIKVKCPDCGYTVRTTRQWIDKGLPVCPCGTEMQEA